MKIVEETPTRLRLQHLPIRRWLSGGSFFIGCLGFLIYCLFFDFASARLTCDRPLPNEMNCELRRSALLGRKQRLRIFDIQNAYVKSISRGRGGTQYHVVIVTPLGERDLISGQRYGKNQQDSQQINNFINSGNRSLLVEQNQRSLLLFKNLFALVVIAISVFELTAPVSICVFYKSLNQVFIERKSLRVKRIIEEPLENILRLEIQDKQFKYGRQYRAVIVLKFGKEIPINPEYTDERSVYSTVARIKSFLGDF